MKRILCVVGMLLVVACGVEDLSQTEAEVGPTVTNRQMTTILTAASFVVHRSCDVGFHEPYPADPATAYLGDAEPFVAIWCGESPSSCIPPSDYVGTENCNRHKCTGAGGAMSSGHTEAEVRACAARIYDKPLLCRHLRLPDCFYALEGLTIPPGIPEYF